MLISISKHTWKSKPIFQICFCWSQISSSSFVILHFYFYYDILQWKKTLSNLEMFERFFFALKDFCSNLLSSTWYKGKNVQSCKMCNKMKEKFETVVKNCSDNLFLPVHLRKPFSPLSLRFQIQASLGRCGGGASFAEMNDTCDFIFYIETTICYRQKMHELTVREPPLLNLLLGFL